MGHRRIGAPARGARPSGFPPLRGFVGKTMLFGAALGAGWTWLAIVMGLNVALSLYYYVWVIEPLYLRPLAGERLAAEPLGFRVTLIVLGVGMLITGVLPQPWVALADRTAHILASSLLH